jgi:hypothetical protein
VLQRRLNRTRQATHETEGRSHAQGRPGDPDTKHSAARDPDGQHRLVLLYQGKGDSGRRPQRLVRLALDGSFEVVRFLLGNVHGLSLGNAAPAG